MSTHHVGVLIPSSSIFQMGKFFKKGLTKLNDQNHSGKEVVFHYEFIGNGSPKLVEEAYKKLVEFYDVELITGIVSNHTVMHLRSLIEICGIPFIVNNLGAHTLYFDKWPNNVLWNSDHIWKQIWSLGHWAVKNFGQKGMLAGGVYDMAYNFPQMFDLGMKAANADSKWSFAVSHIPQGQGSFSDPSVVLDYIERERPDFVFAAFCGIEATAFMDGYLERGFSGQVPLLITPYMLGPVTDCKQPESLTLYSTELDFMSEGQNEPGSKNENTTEVFETLGQESALLIDRFLQGGLDLDELMNKSIAWSRGEHSFSVLNGHDGARVSVQKHLWSKERNQIMSEQVETCPTVLLSDETIQGASKNLVSTWFNPYLSV